MTIYILMLMMLRYKNTLQHYTTLKNVEWEVENSREIFIKKKNTGKDFAIFCNKSKKMGE